VNTYPTFTGTTSIGNSTYPVSETTSTPIVLKFGTSTEAATHNSIIHQRGVIGVDGDAQTNQVVAYNSVDPGANNDLYTDGSSTKIEVPNNTLLGFEIHLVAFGQAGNQHRCFRKYEGAIVNIGGTTTLVGSVTEFIVAEDINFITTTITADNANDALNINVSEDRNDSQIKVAAYVRYTQTKTQ
jgi:hypothetical protein